MKLKTIIYSLCTLFFVTNNYIEAAVAAEAVENTHKKKKNLIVVYGFIQNGVGDWVHVREVIDFVKIQFKSADVVLRLGRHSTSYIKEGLSAWKRVIEPEGKRFIDRSIDPRYTKHFGQHLHTPNGMLKASYFVDDSVKHSDMYKRMIHNKYLGEKKQKILRKRLRRWNIPRESAVIDSFNLETDLRNDLFMWSLDYGKRITVIAVPTLKKIPQKGINMINLAEYGKNWKMYSGPLDNQPSLNIRPIYGGVGDKIYDTPGECELDENYWAAQKREAYNTISGKIKFRLNTAKDRVLVLKSSAMGTEEDDEIYYKTMLELEAFLWYKLAIIGREQSIHILANKDMAEQVQFRFSEVKGITVLVDGVNVEDAVQGEAESKGDEIESQGDEAESNGEGDRIIQVWTNVRIEDNSQYRSLAYPSSDMFASGDDTFSTAMWLGLNEPVFSGSHNSFGSFAKNRFTEAMVGGPFMSERQLIDEPKIDIGDHVRKFYKIMKWVLRHVYSEGDHLNYENFQKKFKQTFDEDSLESLKTEWAVFRKKFWASRNAFKLLYPEIKKFIEAEEEEDASTKRAIRKFQAHRSAKKLQAFHRMLIRQQGKERKERKEGK